MIYRLLISLLLLVSLSFASLNTRDFSYDESGNRSIDSTSNEVKHYEYSPLGPLEKITIIKNLQGDVKDTTVLRIVSDGAGRKILSLRENADTLIVERRYVWDGNFVIADSGIGDASWNYYPHLGTQPTARVTLNETKDTLIGEWWLRDQQGTVQLVLDDSANVRGRYLFDPYGNLELYKGDKQARYLYTGKEFLPDLGLYYFNARLYDPKTLSFIGQDVLRESSSGYSYAKNNPLFLGDPDGNSTLAQQMYVDCSMAWTNRDIPKSIKIAALGGMGIAISIAIYEEGKLPSYIYTPSDGGYSQPTIIPGSELTPQIEAPLITVSDQVSVSQPLITVPTEIDNINVVFANTIVVPKEKADVFNDWEEAANNGTLVRTDPKTVRGSGFRNKLKNEVGDPPASGYDADHKVELCVGGADCVKTNGQWLESGPNRSSGPKVYHQVKNDPIGTVYDNVELEK
jgi:RHS repeat-associated protein